MKTKSAGKTYEINARPGGGWEVSLMEHGAELGRGIFPADAHTTDAMARNDAIGDGLAWLVSAD
jgi:hypothetical protein